MTDRGHKGPKKNHWYFLLYLATYSNSCQVSGLVKIHHRHDFFGVDYLHKYANFKLQPGHGFRAFPMRELRYVSKLYYEISVFVLLSTGLPARGWHKSSTKMHWPFFSRQFCRLIYHTMTKIWCISHKRGEVRNIFGFVFVVGILWPCALVWAIE